MIDNILSIIEWILIYVFVATAINIYYTGFPILKISIKQKKETYLIKKENYSETQSKMECAAFSSAYVYRHLGKNAKGMDLYNQITCKMNNGGVYCKGIVKLAKKYGFHARIRIGNIVALRNAVAKGTPVIVLIHSKLNSSGFHYIPIVGYDKEYFYAVDSIEKFRNEETEYYNRKIPVEEFYKFWNTSEIEHPLITHIFIEITD